MPNLRSAAAGLVALTIVVSSARGAAAESAPPPRPALVELGPIPPAAVAPTDPMAATRAYLETLSPQARAGSDAYFEGGYWLILWNFLVGSAISLILLFSGASAKMRDYAARISRRRPLQAGVYWVQYLVVTGILGFPLAVYQGYFREHDYGLSNMTFGAWFGDEAKGFLVGIILGGVAMMVLYFILARASAPGGRGARRRRWSSPSSRSPSRRSTSSRSSTSTRRSPMRA